MFVNFSEIFCLEIFFSTLFYGIKKKIEHTFQMILRRKHFFEKKICSQKLLDNFENFFFCKINFFYQNLKKYLSIRFGRF